MEGNPHHHHNLPPQYHQHRHDLQHHFSHQQQQQQQQQIVGGIDTTLTSSDRFPQWSYQETKEFLMIRSEFDQTFMETKRNKLLWEAIATRMKEKGYNRSNEQCKCKWKNLVTRYKGCETMEPEAVRQQFPFYNEMQAIFAGRMQRMLWAEAEGGGSGSLKRKAEELSSDEELEENINISDNETDNTISKVGNVKNKKKKAKICSSSNINVSSSSSGNINSIREMLEDFMQQQLKMEMQWNEAFETRERERRMREMEWREKMLALENERLVMERRRREREEGRRVAEEARAERRDALINELLNKLRRDDD
ncbi:hypothetical protein ACFE04_031181 [Oxalis oulophora]